MIIYSIRRYYSIVVSPHLKMWLLKIHFGFKIHFRPIHDEQLLFRCHRQPQYQALRKRLVRLPPLNYLIILLLMVFPLHFEKANILVHSILFPKKNFYSHLSYSFRSYFFFGPTLGSQECIRSTVYSSLGSGDARGVDGLRAEWDLGVGHTSTMVESLRLQIVLHH